MRGSDDRTECLFSYVSCEAQVPLDHPLRLIRAVVDEALEALSGEFERRYARMGHPSIPPEKLLRALLRTAPTSRGGVHPVRPDTRLGLLTAGR